MSDICAIVIFSSTIESFLVSVAISAFFSFSVFLQDKIDQFPEIGKEITNDLNIVSKEINSVNSISRNENRSQKQEKSNIQLNVNDPDLYEDANRNREEESQEQEEEVQKSRGFIR